MKKSELREHIINVASDLFYVNGYNATGINEIIAKSDIAKATLYSHFASKDELCIAHLKKMNSDFMEGLDSFIRSKRDIKQQILGIFDYLREMYYKDGFNGCWCINCFAEIGPKNVKIKEEIQAQKMGLVTYLAKIVQQNFPFNSIAETDKLSSAIYLLYESAVSESHLHKKDWPIYAAKQVAKQLLPEKIQKS
jgi:AcrR family transcriptional regulator